MASERSIRRNVALGLALSTITAFVFLYQFTDMETLSTRIVARTCFADDADYWRSVDVDRMSPEEMMSYVAWSNRSSCTLAHDFGGKMFKNPSGLDGQKSVCILPTSVAPPGGNCVVYSFGINNEWSFDDAMASYGCSVYSFDPSMKVNDHDRSESIHFFNLGLSSRDSSNKKGWLFKSLASIYEMLQPKHGPVTIDYLKLDIEFDEWIALPQILESGMLDRVRQLGVEVHIPLKDTLTQMRERVKILRSLEDYGMVRFDSKLNAWYSGKFKLLNYAQLPRGYEIAWYNKRFL